MANISSTTRSEVTLLQVVIVLSRSSKYKIIFRHLLSEFILTIKLSIDQILVMHHISWESSVLHATLVRWGFCACVMRICPFLWCNSAVKWLTVLIHALESFMTTNLVDCTNRSLSVNNISRCSFCIAMLTSTRNS